MVSYNESPPIPGQPQAITNYQPLKVKPNDILQINVASTDPLAIQPFSLGGGETGAAEYLVSSDGSIDFPTIGKVDLKGLQIEEVKAKIAGLIAPYLQEAPIVQVRLTNFKVNVNGEVGNPGSFSVRNDRMTLIDAITLAGDFTNYSMRDSILIIREEDGMRSFGYANFNSPSVFESEYFYLQQNDVLYVKPDKTIVGQVRDPASRIIPWISAAVSFTALIFTLSRL